MAPEWYLLHIPRSLCEECFVWGQGKGARGWVGNAKCQGEGRIKGYRVGAGCGGKGRRERRS